MKKMIVQNWTQIQRQNLLTLQKCLVSKKDPRTKKMVIPSMVLAKLMTVMVVMNLTITSATLQKVN